LFYEKWIGDFVDEQRQSGELPGIIPTSGWGYHWGNGPAWDSALLLIPWYIYEYYGDDNLIKKYYDNYKKYVDYLTFRADDNILHIGLGDWSPYKTRTPAEFTSTCYYYVDANLLSKYARMNSKDDDAKYYSALANRIKNTINNRLFDKDKFIYSNGSQTALSAALFQSVVPDELKAKVAENLADEVHKNNDHLDVGLLGSKYLLNALSDNGYTKLAYKVASQKTRPSWGWWLLNGETTFQESWEIGPSRNHIMFGEIVAWLFKDLAGIKVDSAHPSFRNIIIKPGFNTGLTHVKASTKCVNGTIISEWSKKNNNISLTITIPANSTATVYLPVISAEKVYESGLLVKSSKYIKFSGRKRSNFIYQVAAGKYYFEIKR